MSDKLVKGILDKNFVGILNLDGIILRIDKLRYRLIFSNAFLNSFKGE